MIPFSRKPRRQQPQDGTRAGAAMVNERLIPTGSNAGRTPPHASGNAAPQGRAMTGGNVMEFGAPKGNRTPVPAVRGRCPDR